MSMALGGSVRHFTLFVIGAENQLWQSGWELIGLTVSRVEA
jgi:hypothetical protein